MRKIYFLKPTFFLIYVLLLHSVYAQNTNEWYNLTYGTEVRCMAEEDGFLWLGTSGGLVRIDKLTHERNFFNKSNSGLPDIYINDILIDSNGGKWIATQQGGVAYFDNQNWTVYNTLNSNLPINEIGDLQLDNSNNLWLAATNKIFKYDHYSFEYFEPVGAQTDFNIFKKIAFDTNGYMWVACQNHIFKVISPASIVKYDAAHFGLTSMHISDLKIDDDNTIWIATNGYGIIKFEGFNYQRFDSGNSPIPSDMVKSIEIIDDDLFVSTFNGLAVLNNQNWTVYNASNTPMQSNKITCASKYGSNAFWLGTHGDGLLKLSGNTCQQINTSNSILRHSNIYNMVIDKNGDKWFATFHGLARLEGNNMWTLYTMENSPLPDNIVNDIAIDDNNIKWLATQNGLAKFDGVNWQIFNTSNTPLPSNIIGKLHICESGFLWLIIHNEGFAKYDGQQWVLFNTSNSDLPSNMVNTIYTVDDEIWIGTSFSGIVKLKNLNWTLYNTTNSNLHSNFIMSFNRDFNGNIIVGTLHGPSVFNGTDFSLLDTLSLLNSPSGVYSIDFDTDSSMLICTGNGLFIYKDSLVKHYHFFNAPLTSFNVSRAIRDSDGNLWLPTICGGIDIYNENGVVLSNKSSEAIVESSSKVILYQNYPNPFNNSTTIEFYMPEDAFVCLSVLDLNGKIVFTPISCFLSKGSYSIPFNSEGLKNGMYFYCISSENFKEIKRMILLK